MGIKITDYASAKSFFSNARNKPAGRPLGVSSLRMFQRGHDYVVGFQGYSGSFSEVCRYTPDNKLTFTMPMEKFIGWSQSLTTVGERAFDVHFIRYAKGKYRAIHDKELQPMLVKAREEWWAGLSQEKRGLYADRQWQTAWYSSQAGWSRVKREGPEYFEGITFDCATGECLNRQADLKPIIDKEARRDWLRRIKHFKKQLKIRVKLMDVQSMAESFRYSHTPGATYTRSDFMESHITDDQMFQKLFHSFQQDEYPADLIKDIIRWSMPRWYFNDYGSDKATYYKLIDRVCDKFSKQMREELGVITGYDRA